MLITVSVVSIPMIIPTNAPLERPECCSSILDNVVSCVVVVVVEDGVMFESESVAEGSSVDVCDILLPTLVIGIVLLVAALVDVSMFSLEINEGMVFPSVLVDEFVLVSVVTAAAVPKVVVGVMRSSEVVNRGIGTGVVESDLDIVVGEFLVPKVVIGVTRDTVVGKAMLLPKMKFIVDKTNHVIISLITHQYLGKDVRPYLRALSVLKWQELLVD